MAFSVTNTTIENYKLVQGLVAPAEKGPNSAYVFTIPTPPGTGYISLGELSGSSGSLRVANSANSTLVLPPSSELAQLFTNPSPGSAIDFHVTTDDSNPLEVVGDSNSVTLVGSAGNFYKMALQVGTGPTDPSGTDAQVLVHYSPYNSSILMPVPLYQQITGSATLLWHNLNASSASPSSVVVGGALGAPATLTLDSAANLWGVLFGSANMPSVGVVYVNNVAIINNSGNTLTIAAGTGLAVDGTLAIPNHNVAQLQIKFTSKTNAQAYVTAVAFSI